MRLKLHILVALIILSSVLAAYCAPPPDADDDHFFRVKPAAGTADPTKKPATVNPKKSPLPIGPTVTPMRWNDTAFAYFGGWGQLVSTDVHHFYIDTESIAAVMSDTARKNPIYLQLRQKTSDKVHVELFMSNGAYPTPGSHKFATNTRDSQSVYIKLPSFGTAAHWLIRVQPSEPLSVWSKSLEYSLRLYEHESNENPFSESWEGAILTFILVLGSTVGLIFYLRSLKDKEAQEKAQEKDKRSSFNNLNSDTQFLSLSEAQDQAKSGGLEQIDASATLGRHKSTMELNRQVEAIIRSASPGGSTLSKTTSQATNSASISTTKKAGNAEGGTLTATSSKPPVTAPKPAHLTNKTDTSTGNLTASSPSSGAAPSTTTNTNKSNPSTLVDNDPAKTSSDKRSAFQRNVTPSPDPSKATPTASSTSSSVTSQSSATTKPTSAESSTSSSPSTTSSSSTAAAPKGNNVKKMTEFWAKTKDS